ncbi:MAG TPA: hypothetical protein VFO89_12415 [Thermoanaerobaculia bacterium]|nr:hypothetical protein [Thermoanaerobaculia bacterium]
MSNRHLMGRRQFLIASSACVAAAAAIGPRLFAAADAAARPQRLVIGFASFDEGASLVPASSIPAGDGAFIGRGARVSVSGASGAPPEPRARRAVELLVNHSYFDGAERRTAPFVAWACSRATGCQGNTVNFTVPVDDVQSLSLTVGSERGAVPGDASRRQAISIDATESVALPVDLGIQHDAALKLARGFYIIVPMFEGDAEPSWSRFSLARVDGRWALVDGEGAVAPFEHFVIRVDYAS